jgi:hypothetical protein
VRPSINKSTYKLATEKFYAAKAAYEKVLQLPGGRRHRAEKAEAGRKFRQAENDYASALFFSKEGKP